MGARILGRRKGKSMDDGKTGFNKQSLSVQGSDKGPVPDEILRFYKEGTISISFLETHYGLGKSMHIEPKVSEFKARMMGTA
jgi:hypothetical protein